MSKKLIQKIKRELDWRKKWLILAGALTVGVTLLTFVASISLDLSFTNASKFAGAVFASWVASVLFFLVVGIIVAVVSLARPESESFESRLRILFQQQRGDHIDYIIERFKGTFEQYAAFTEAHICVEEYNKTEGKFYVTVTRKIHIKSYIDDANTAYKSQIKHEEICEPPQNARPNRMDYLRIDEEMHAAPESFISCISKDVRTTVPAGGTCKIEYSLSHWVKEIEEENTHTPARFTQKYVLRVQNKIEGLSLIVKIKSSSSENFVETILRSGDYLKVLELNGLRPGIIAYDYRLGVYGG